jgi:hypothetical protein
MGVSGITVTFDDKHIEFIRLVDTATIAEKPNHLTIGQWTGSADSLTFSELRFCNDSGSSSSSSNSSSSTADAAATIDDARQTWTVRLHCKNDASADRQCIALFRVPPSTCVDITNVFDWLDEQNLASDLPLQHDGQLSITVDGCRMYQSHQKQHGDREMQQQQQHTEMLQHTENPTITLVTKDNASAAESASAGTPTMNAGCDMGGSKSLVDSICDSVARDDHEFNDPENRKRRPGIPFYESMTFKLIIALVVALLLLWLLWRLGRFAMSWFFPK